MKVAITGGTGFVGGHLAEALSSEGHEVVLVARGLDPHAEERGRLAGATIVATSVGDEDALVAAFEDCQVVVHCAGINRETGTQTYDAVHVQGTRNVVSAAKRVGAERIALLSYLRARPRCGSGYLESKWAAEEIVRKSGLGYLVIKSGMIFGRGDHMLDHISKAVGTFRLFVRVGFGDRPVRPVAVQDVVTILRAFVLEGRLIEKTVAVVGPERMTLSGAARRVAEVMGVRVVSVPMPIWVLYALGWVAERLMKVPLVSVAQVRLLKEGPEPGPPAEELPADLSPQTQLSRDLITSGLPERRRYGLEDLRWVRMSRIVVETCIASPPERCFDLCRTVDVHLSVPGAKETVVDGVKSGAMELGDHVTWRSTRFGIPVRMTSRITEFERPYRFVDEMQRGPFRRWRHVHRYERTTDGTLMVDEIDFASPLGPMGRVADAAFVRRYMTGVVRRQNEHIKRLAEGSGAEESGGPRSR